MKHFFESLYRRTYYVVACAGNKIHSWESICGPFLPWQRVDHNLIKSWRQYSNDRYQRDDSVILSFTRIKF